MPLRCGPATRKCSSARSSSAGARSTSSTPMTACSRPASDAAAARSSAYGQAAHRRGREAGVRGRRRRARPGSPRRRPRRSGPRARRPRSPGRGAAPRPPLRVRGTPERAYSSSPAMRSTSRAGDHAGERTGHVGAPVGRHHDVHAQRTAVGRQPADRLHGLAEAHALEGRRERSVAIEQEHDARQPGAARPLAAPRRARAACVQRARAGAPSSRSTRSSSSAAIVATRSAAAPRAPAAPGCAKSSA